MSGGSVLRCHDGWFEVVYGMGGGDVCVWCRRMIVGEL